MIYFSSTTLMGEQNLARKHNKFSISQITEHWRERAHAPLKVIGPKAKIPIDILAIIK